MMPAIVSTSLIGSPSSQCCCIGHARATFVNLSGSLRALSCGSDAAANNVTDHVSLSPGNVRIENVPIALNAGPIEAGSCAPVK